MTAFLYFLSNQDRMHKRNYISSVNKRLKNKLVLFVWLPQLSESESTSASVRFSVVRFSDADAACCSFGRRRTLTQTLDSDAIN